MPHYFKDKTTHLQLVIEGVSFKYQLLRFSRGEINEAQIILHRNIFCNCIIPCLLCAIGSIIYCNTASRRHIFPNRNSYPDTHSTLPHASNAIQCA